MPFSKNTFGWLLNQPLTASITDRSRSAGHLGASWVAEKYDSHSGQGLESMEDEVTPPTQICPTNFGSLSPCEVWHYREGIGDHETRDPVACFLLPIATNSICHNTVVHWLYTLSPNNGREVLLESPRRQKRRDSARCISYQRVVWWTELAGSCSRKNRISRQSAVQI